MKRKTLVIAAALLASTAVSPANAHDTGPLNRCETERDVQQSIQCLRDVTQLADRARRAVYLSKLIKADEPTKLQMIDSETAYVATREKICDAESQTQYAEAQKKVVYLNCFYRSTMQRMIDTPAATTAVTADTPAATAAVTAQGEAWGCRAENNQDIFGVSWGSSERQNAADGAVATCQRYAGGGGVCELKECVLGLQTEAQADQFWPDATHTVRLYTAPRLYAAPRPTTFSVKADVSGGVLNLRDGPGVNTQILVALPAGANGIEMTGQCVDLGKPYAAAWCPVKWLGHEGWLSACCITN
jgi:uncharacterized protein YecT (DUF1311 family)